MFYSWGFAVTSSRGVPNILANMGKRILQNTFVDMMRADDETFQHATCVNFCKDVACSPQGAAASLLHRV